MIFLPSFSVCTLLAWVGLGVHPFLLHLAVLLTRILPIVPRLPPGRNGEIGLGLTRRVVGWWAGYVPVMAVVGDRITAARRGHLGVR